MVSSEIFIPFRGLFRALSTSKMGHFEKIVEEFKPLITFTKCSILDVWQISEYTFAI